MERKRINVYSRVLPINELYTALQGEGKRAGMPTVVIRTTGCTHRCFVKIPGRAAAVVYPVVGPAKKIWDVAVGDKLMAWDELSQSIVETEVTGLENDEVDEYVMVYFEDHNHLCVTPEHPFLTTRGWKMAVDLLDTDELVHISGKMRNSYRMRTNNPMKVSETVEKVHSHPNFKNWKSHPKQLKAANDARLEKYGTLHPDAPLTDKEYKAKYKRVSERMKADNPMFNPLYLSASIATKYRNGHGRGWSMGQGMSSCEEKFWTLMENNNLSELLWFTGDGGFTLKCQGKLKVPDFKIHGQNKFIEVGEPVWFRKDWEEYDKELYEIYSKSSLPNTKYLSINMAEMSDVDIVSRVRSFVTNGIKISKVRKIKAKKKYPTYNLHCDSHHNYLVSIGRHQSVVSHNCYFGEGGWCDAWRNSIHPEKGIFKFNDIIQIYRENPQITEMMLTGGAPTMHPALVNELTHFAQENGIYITMETEGSHYIETDYPIDMLSISPKFSNSIPELGIETPGGKIVDKKFIKLHERFRLNKDAIMQMIRFHKAYQYKPVWDGKDETLDEIEKFRIELGIPKELTYIMPGGDNREQLIKVYPEVMEMCIKMGYRFTGRPHIIAYDTKRCV